MNLLKYLVLYLLFTFPLFASENMSAEELEKWFVEDTPATNKEVNSGQLLFLTSPPVKPALHSSNVFIIDNTSIEEGWVTLTQCYENLDAVPLTEVVFQYRFMRNLKIKSTKNIQQARVINQSVELKNIKKNARLCISAEVRNFYQNEDKTYSLINGPYHRKFLDGYFPYHLSMDIHFPRQLRFILSQPKQQKGFILNKQQNRIIIDAWFEGKLESELRFELIK